MNAKESKMARLDHKTHARLMAAALAMACACILCLSPSIAHADSDGVTKTMSGSMRQYQVSAIDYDRGKLKYLSSDAYWHVLWGQMANGSGSMWYGRPRFESSNKKVAKVSSDGVITARRKGKATITATAFDNELKVRLTVKAAKRKPVKLSKLQCYGHFRRYMTNAQFKRAYKKAVSLTRPLLDLNRKAKLYGVAATLRWRFDNLMTYSMKAPHYNDPYGYLMKNTASCAGCARTTGMCLNILGISFEHVHENRYCHQWARVKVGGQHWICDAYGLYVGKEPGKRKHPTLN